MPIRSLVVSAGRSEASELVKIAPPVVYHTRAMSLRPRELRESYCLAGAGRAIRTDADVKKTRKRLYIVHGNGFKVTKTELLIWKAKREDFTSSFSNLSSSR